MVHIGIDPTKKNPYLLLGGGFVIPSAKIAIAGGPIWTWEQELKTLKVGDSVSSTIQLEEDIENNFDSRIKGWYLGVQLNF